MIAYFDASALVKRYVSEHRSDETIELSTKVDVVATSLVIRAEVAAAFAKAVRSGLLSDDEARKAQRTFAGEWPDLARIPVTEALVARAETLAWDHAFRGYDAVHLRQRSHGRRVSARTSSSRHLIRSFGRRRGTQV